MKKVEKNEIKYVSLNTALIIGLVGLVVGFLAGNIYNVYKANVEVAAAAGPDSSQPDTTQMSARIFAIERQLETNPNNQAAWLELGNLYFDTDRPKESIAAYKKYLEFNPQNADVWTDMGVMQRRAGNPAEAVLAFNKALELNPGHEQARFNKGIVQYYDLGNRESALKVWKELAEINPNFRTPNGETIQQLLARL